MSRSPLQPLAAFSVPVHLNILAWGAVAVAAYALAPEIFESAVVRIGLLLFSVLYTVVAMILLFVRLGAPEAARPIPMLSARAVAMALVGAALLLFVGFETGGVAGRALALAAPAIGVLCGIASAASVRRSAR